MDPGNASIKLQHIQQVTFVMLVEEIVKQYFMQTGKQIHIQFLIMLMVGQEQCLQQHVNTIQIVL